MEHFEVYDNSLPVGERLAGKTVAVVNRSEVVGRPLAAMLANDGATVYSVDIDSLYIFRRTAGRGHLEMPPSGTTAETALRSSDIVVLGVPSPSYSLPVSWVKENAVVINVASHKNVDEKSLLAERPGVRYMGQVGKITVGMLERNLLRLYENFGKERAAGKSGHASIAG
jgi:methylenetetrahydrofolate dehydrogenase (NAD+)